jgi:hypothetical protein
MNDDGRCIYNRYFTPAAPPKNLVTGMLTALQGFVRELTGEFPSILGTEGDHPFTFYFQKRGPVTIVLAISDKISQPTEINEIGLRFLRNYGADIENWKGQDDYFEAFTEDLIDLLGEDRTSRRVDPKNPINAFTLLSLDVSLQNIAKELINLKETTSQELAERLGLSEYPLRMQLEELVELGHLGRYFSKDGYTYFTN